MQWFIDLIRNNNVFNGYEITPFTKQIHKYVGKQSSMCGGVREPLT